jgi:glutamate-1-semialdehyde 2,1-aminomutase
MLREEIENAALEQFLAENPNSLALHDEAEQYLWGGVTHNGRYWEPTGVYIDRAEGAYKWDVDGHRYIDYWMGHGSLIFGHSHPTITAAATEQLARGTHYGGNHAGEVRWAELICRLVPSAEKVRFFSSGTEATMMALRLARTATGRDKIIKLDGRFHGWHDYSVMKKTAQPPVGIPQAVANTVEIVPANLEVIESLLQSREFAGVIVEADGASWGTVPNPPGFLQSLRELTRSYGAILIFDEIVSGFRYAPGGIQELEGVVPDLTCLAKILAGGLPGGAVAGRADLLEAFSPKTAGNKFIVHHGTYNANPLSAAAGIAALTMLAAPDAKERVYNYINGLALRLRAGFNQAIASAGLSGKAMCYGRGSIIHVLIGGEQVTEWPVDGDIYNPAFATELARPEVQARLRAGIPVPVLTALRLELDLRGVQLMAGHGGFISTAHTAADIDQTVNAFAEAVTKIKL